MTHIPPISETYITVTKFSEPKIMTLFFDNRKLFETNATGSLKSRLSQKIQDISLLNILSGLKN